MIRQVFKLALLSGLLSVPVWAQQVTYVFSDGNIPGTILAYKALLEERPDLRGQVSMNFLTESVFDEANPQDLLDTDVLVLDVMNQEMLDRFNTANDIDLIRDIAARGTVLTVGVGVLPTENYTDQGAVWDERAHAFWTGSGFSNQLGLIKQALVYAGITDLVVPDPQPALNSGYYYPDGPSGRVFATWEEFDRWRTDNGKKKPGALRVAVGFYKADYYGGDTELLNAVIAEIERQGGEAIPIFGYPAGPAFEGLLLDPDGQRRADTSLAFLFRFADFEAAKALERLDIPVVSMISLYGRTEVEWRESKTGLSIFEGTFQVAVPEIAGTVAPTVVGSHEKRVDEETGLTIVTRHPIASRVTVAVARALRYGTLRVKANADKRVALMFYNYPPGKASIGASYLNVAESLSNVLQGMRDEGYDLGLADLSPESVLRDITTKARNVGGYAPGELEALLAEGTAILIPIADYQRWLDGYAPGFRDKVIADWGNPGDTTLMATNGPDGPSLVIPAVQYENVIVMPQPARGKGEDDEKLYHAKDLAPHHQYVATYAWLRNGYGADAVVHMGTHGTLEWLDGKDIGLSAQDASDALMADLPDLYIYNVDVVGEGLVARRRGMATLIDHMVPPFTRGGLYPELAALSESINDYDNNLHKNPELSLAFADAIRLQVIDLGIAKDLGLDLPDASALDDAMVHEIQAHMVDLRSQNIPFGLHAFGRVPEKPLRDSTIDAIVSVDRSLLPNDAEVLTADMDERIVASGPRELASLFGALSGGFVPTGAGGEPIRNPDSYPTGKNFYGVDPDKIPKEAAWNLGVALADQMLADHLEKNGRYPQKVSFVIWGDETMRHEGILESQIFHLLGTRPVWDVRGNVVGVDVVPSARLGRPRVDIVIASAAEGMFNNVTLLMDEAVQRVKVIEEAENYVRDHYLETRSVLMETGYSEEDADRLAGVRIFDEPPGTFELNTSNIIAASGTWDSDRAMTDEYLMKMGHGFGNGFWGEPMEDVFRLALSGTEKVVHSSSTMLYGALDNDDFYMYMGGLAAAVRNIDGATPEMVVTNTRDPGKAEMTSIDEFIGTEFRSRYVNPTWIEGMKNEGYAGAGEMRAFVEYLWGWEATARDVIDDPMWQESFEVYVEDKHALGMEDFFEENSPFAYQDLTARMIETVRKDYWDADIETETRLLDEYIDSVNRHGVGCAEHTCGNPRLSQYVLDRALELGIPVPAIESFQEAMEQAIGVQITSAAMAAVDFVRRNEALFEDSSVPEDISSVPQVEGFMMNETQSSQPVPQAVPSGLSNGDWDGLWVGLPLLGLLFAWRWRRGLS